MSSKTIAIIVAVVLIVGAGIYVSSQRSQKDSISTQDQSVNTTSNTSDNELTRQEDQMLDNATVQPDQPSQITRGLYVAYNDANFSQAVARKDKIVLFFHAAWCPTCRAVETEVMQNADVIPKGVTVLKVDYDNSEALKKKYGVVIQHTFVQVDPQKNKIVSWSGTDAAMIATKIK